MKMTEMMDGDQFQDMKNDLHQEAIPVKGGSAYDMTDSQKKYAELGREIKAALSPRSSDIKWPDDQEWLNALKFSEALIDADKEDKIPDIMSKIPDVTAQQAQDIIDKVKAGNVDVTKSVPDPDGDNDGIDKLAQAIKNA